MGELAEFPYLDAALDADLEEAFNGEDNPLRAEMVAHPATLAALQQLRELGVPPMAIAQLNGVGDLGVAGVDLHAERGARSFEFGGPDRRLILAVRDDRHRVVDLVALASHDENEWALRTGHGLLLGHDWLHCVDQAATEEDWDALWMQRKRRAVRLRLWATPLAWLRAGCEGICVVEWGRGALTALRSLGSGVTLVVEPGAKARLDAMLQHGGLPLVAEDRETHRRAA